MNPNPIISPTPPCAGRPTPAPIISSTARADFRAWLEDSIEEAIALLDAFDAQTEDLEPCPDFEEEPDNERDADLEEHSQPVTLSRESRAPIYSRREPPIIHSGLLANAT